MKKFILICLFSLMSSNLQAKQYCPPAHIVNDGKFFYAEHRSGSDYYFIEGAAERRWIFYVFWIKANSESEAINKGNDALKNKTVVFNNQMGEECVYTITIDEHPYKLSLYDTKRASH